MAKRSVAGVTAMVHRTVIALAGNPNAGKSTVFNALTGAQQHVGNWPGKTVESKRGQYAVNGNFIEVVDLPGMYSLSGFSEEQQIGLEYLLTCEAQLVVLVVDASNLERNLYLALQILEMEIPVIVALNMSDLVVRQGEHIDIDSLSKRLGGLSVVPTTATKGEGVDQLKHTIAEELGLLEPRQRAI
jgi:ferrous iron transport protein B